jgi:predicted DNA-binding transcriptional regulator AlpA
MTFPTFSHEGASMPAKTIQSTELPSAGFVRLSTILKLYPVSASTWWAGVKDGRFPAGFKLSERITVWRVEDIRALLASVETASREA